jgi:hypothetical protein
MILSTQNIFSDKQAITASAASTNIIDTGQSGNDLGFGTPIPMLIQVTQAFNLLTSLTVALQSSDSSAFSSPDTVVSTTVPLAGLTLGARIAVNNVPYGTLKRYLRLYYTVTGSNSPTTGQITAGITAGNDETPPFV